MFGWFKPGQDNGGRRRGRWFGDDAPWGGRRGTVLLGLVLLILVVLFVVSCLA